MLQPICDIEGTLMDNSGRRIPTTLISYLQKLEARGIRLILCSGRDKSYQLNLRRQWGLADTEVSLIAENGCVVVYRDHEYVTFDAASYPREKIVDKLIAENILACAEFDPAKKYVITLYPKGFSRGRKFTQTDVMRIYEQVKDVLQEFEYTIVYSSASTDIMPRYVDKSSGLRKLCAVSGLTPNQILFIGDSNNDLSAAKFVVAHGGKVCVPNNATLELKKIATYISEASDGLGTIEILMRYFRNL
jgi:hypothetical protein